MSSNSLLTRITACEESSPDQSESESDSEERVDDETNSTEPESSGTVQVLSVEGSCDPP